MIEFTYPQCFILLFAPIIIYLIAPTYKEKRSSVQVPYFEQLVDITGEKPQLGAVVLTRKNIQKLLLVLAWFCLVVAMAKPEMIGAAVTQQKSARDLMIAVDLSGSMDVEDFYLPNQGGNQTNSVDRLTAVKQVLREFVSQRENDRLGLILFGDAPYLQAPFTNDLDTWLTLLNDTQVGMAGQSTAFGDAIGLSISVFGHHDTQNRVLIVLTDGNDTASKVPPVEAAKVAAASDIKIYTIAIGDPAAADEEKVDLAVLQSIADITGGKSFQAIDTKALENVYTEINQLEPELFESQTFRPRTSIHYIPIALFLSLYLISLLIVTFRFPRKIKETR
ncbi:VWA domain-containing protein [Shewanella sp. KT0246]|uniref:vWA domain-containing protein n=1 Tax=Shewanella sp. KT0246 TaxID=2815912 RepID=UPI001BBF941B|nr:VWA domain-containing protein [Shewanella sp. KT0246]GIU53229.1 VWA domain-containing protein [Shewanella sp. KT0246]